MPDLVRDQANQASLNVTTNELGLATVPVTLPRTGPIRIWASLVDDATVAHTCDVIVTDGNLKPDVPFDGGDLRVETTENATGTAAKLLITSPAANATALLFLRPESGMMPAPQVLKLNGHSIVVPVDVGRDDIPYVYAEVAVIANGEFFNSAVRFWFRRRRSDWICVGKLKTVRRSPAKRQRSGFRWLIPQELPRPRTC